MSDAARSPEISIPERAFYAVIVVAALFVVLLGYFAPGRMDEAFTWAALPPLHARFVATLYLFGAVYLFTALIARRARTIRPALGGVAVFTGVLFLVTASNIEAFDFSLRPVWIWSASYVVYPVIALALLQARIARPSSGGANALSVAPRWVRGVLLGHAVVFGVLGVLMFILPGPVAAAWPWSATTGVVQAYSSPFLTVAFCAVAHAGRSVWPEVLALLPALLVLELGTLLVSGVHRQLLPPDAIMTWVWLASFLFGALTVTAALVTCVGRAAPRGDGGRGD